MHIPKGMTEEQVLQSIEKVANGKLPNLFRFGYHTTEDMKQLARLLAIKGLPDYDPEKGSLDTFLWAHVHNRLHNNKRNKYERPKPCLACPLNAYDPQFKKSESGCTKYKDKMDCELYASWNKINSKKKNIMNPIGIPAIIDENEERMKVYNDMDSKIDYSDTVELIDKNIPIEHRKNWIKLKSGINIPKSERALLMEAIKYIVNGEGDGKKEG